MGTKQAEYNTGLAEIRADISKFAADLRADISKFASKSETDIGKLAEKMAQRDTRLLLWIMGVVAFGITLLGIFISLLSAG